MGLFKDVITAFKPENLKRGLDAARYPVDQAAIQAQVEAMSPEARAAYDAHMEQVERGKEESRKSWHAAKERIDKLRVLEGPAGRWLYGISMAEIGTPDQIDAEVAAKGALPYARDLLRKQKGEFTTALKLSFNIGAVPQEKDPAKRVVIAKAEREARDAARQPYNAPQRHEIAFSSLATRG